MTSAGDDTLRYKNDLEAYIWQSCCKPPSSSYLKIFILNKLAPRIIRAVVSFGSLASLKTLREERTACRDKFKGTDKVAFRLAHQIYSAYYVALSDTMRLAQEIADVIIEIVSHCTPRLQLVNNHQFLQTFVGRAPSKVKVQHLLHMNDRREKAIQDRHKISHTLTSLMLSYSGFRLLSNLLLPWQTLLV